MQNLRSPFEHILFTELDDETNKTVNIRVSTGRSEENQTIFNAI